jgi:hypothetical protein
VAQRYRVCQSCARLCVSFQALRQKTVYGLHLQSMIHSDLIFVEVIRSIFKSIFVACECPFVPASLVEKFHSAIESSFFC